jgi:hypothetical protein
MSIRSVGLTTGIFGAAAMFFLAWWLILTGNAEGPVTLFERIYMGYSFKNLRFLELYFISGPSHLYNLLLFLL